MKKENKQQTKTNHFFNCNFRCSGISLCIVWHCVCVCVSECGRENQEGKERKSEKNINSPEQRARFCVCVCVNKKTEPYKIIKRKQS